jgi:MFS transporter, DHA1 family, multidrug resistance protein
MLLRALIGGSAVVIVTAFCQTPLQLLVLRLGYGLLGGQRPIATSIVASETPRNQSARAQGILAMAVSLGSAIGPAAGGLVAQLVGMRATIALAGATVLVSSAGVLAWVRESPSEPSPVAGQPKSSGWRFLPLATRRILYFVFAGQALHMMSATMIIPLLAIRLLAVDPRHVGLTTGIAFGVSGAMTALAALALAPAVSRLGYRGTLPIAMLLSAATTAAIAALTSVTGIIAVFALYGFATGFLLPGASSVTALLTPRSVHGTVFGFTSTAQSGGATFGPLLGGLVGAVFGAQAGLFLAAAIFIGAAVIWVTGTREPDLADPA